MEKVFILLNGPTCVGKSTLIAELGKLREGFFHLSYDRVKWCFLDYKSGTYRDEIDQMLVALTKECIRAGMSAIKDGGIYKERPANIEIISLFKNAGYKIIEVNLEAPQHVLRARFYNRVEQAKLGHHKFANLSEDRFWELNQMYENSKDPSLKTYDTSVMTSEEIAKDILSLI